MTRRAAAQVCALGASVAAEKRPNTFRLVRDIPVDRAYDLVVAGGGPAGVAASICAARLGAKVLLAEATGCLGGMGTSGLVTAFDPMSDGKRTLVMGLMNEIVTTLYRRGFLGPRVTPKFWEASYMTWTPFQVEGYKLVLDELATAAGVEVRFFTRAIDVDVAGRAVNGVVLSSVEGYRYVRAKTFVDGTGDATLAKLCGVTCREAGRDTPHIMPATLCSLFAGIDWAAFQKSGVRQQAALEKALADKFFTQPDRHLPGMSQVGRTVGYLNGGHVFELDSLRVKSLTDGMMLGRRIAQEYMAFYRKYAPGFENLEHVTTAAVMGVRESRRILGEYELGEQDFNARRHFPDQIGVFNKAVDIHPYAATEEEYQRYYREYEKVARLKVGECFGIPYGVIAPKGWKNLWVAGRCASADVKAQGSIRVQPAASMMGQAAGAAAVQSMRTGQPACDLDTAALVESLRKQGAYLPQQRLSSKMTRSV